MQLFLEWKSYWIICLLSLTLFSQGRAQRVFVNRIEGLNRSYLFYSNTTNYDLNSNKPVVIVLHENGQSAREAFAKAPWKSVREPAIFIFPNALKGQWDCSNDSSSANDIQFIQSIITDTYANFHSDRNRVYVLGSGKNECLVDRFRSGNPKTPLTFSPWTAGRTDSLAALGHVADVLKTRGQADTTYALWIDPSLPRKLDPIDSLKGYRLHNRLVIDVRYGGVAMMGSVRTWKTDGTYTDFFKAHSFIDIHLTKWMNDSIAWFLDIGRLKVPMTQEMTESGVIRSGGGMIMPLTLGFKYALPRMIGNPYFLLGSGFIQAMAFGGRMNPGAMSSGTRPNFDAEMRMVFHTTIGTGIDLRLAKRFMVGAHLRYIHSAQFKSAAKVDAIRGFNLNFGLGYILNANSLKKLPFPLTSVK
ncbi:hypothetical protein LZD49_20235 [Dyadobacter sp. CY261]|uniref:hypothetical protein n=1 Tax=Dyadobacter sp. CY261 TaxID=2907203 RepID=UPI001F15D598|nr:hypothetical protein [Dyadobacter sp. CY261]MCF0072820.1 hypothetical protein [Dyadobacter sp. CY261]